MKTLVLSILALAALGLVGTVTAEPVKLSKEQMASIVAGNGAAITTTNGGGHTPQGSANGVPTTTVSSNPAGHQPSGQNK